MNLLAGARLSSRRILSSSSATKSFFYLHHIAALQQCNFYSAKATTTTTRIRTRKSPEKPSISSEAIKEHMEAMTNVWPKPQSIPYHARVANFVNFMGNVKFLVRSDTDSAGKLFTAVVISRTDEGESERGARSIPVVFEGDLAHVVACHVKENDCVFVSGKLNVNPLRWLLSESLDKFHVLAENINFVAESENCALSEKMWASLPAVEIGELGNRNVGENVDSNNVLGLECDSAKRYISAVAESVAVNAENGGSGSKMKDRNDLWLDLANNPLQWLDYRSQKSNELVNGKFPDFKKKGTGESLWINTAPNWILSQLETLEFGEKEMKMGNVSGGEQPSARKRSIGLENLWKDLVENPNKWWDNRMNKRNPKGPDFSHKDTREALWLNTLPDWALSKLPPLKDGRNTTTV